MTIQAHKRTTFALIMAFVGPAGLAQQSPPVTTGSDDAATQSDVQEVVVTGARLRKEDVQETPIAVSVMAPEQIEATHALDIQGLSGRVPNLVVSNAVSTPNTPIISMRGFNTISSDPSVEPGIAVYIDGVYQSILTGSLSDLFDLDSVEVLRGPQGTLLGKNSSAGAILLTRSQPTGELGGKVQIDYGSFNQTQFNGLLNFPILDHVLAGKVFLNYVHRDNFIDNAAFPDRDLGGIDRGTGRLALLFTPTDEFRLYLTGDYQWDRSNQEGLRNVSGPKTLECTRYGLCAPQADQFDVTDSGFLARPHANDRNITAKAEWRPQPVTVTSITGYRHFNDIDNVDVGDSPQPVLDIFGFQQDLRQESEELRVSSRDGGGLDLDGRLNWLAAFFYDHSNVYSPQGQQALGNPTQRAEQVIRNGRAVFTHLDYKVLDPWTVSAGIRESWDSTNHAWAFPIPGSVPPPLNHDQIGSWKNTSVEAGTQFQIDASKMAFFRFAEGYRGGGFVGLPATLAGALEYQPETSKDYELGVKTDWLDRRVQVNITLFNTKYHNLQESAAVPSAGGTFVQATANAAQATTRGVEWEAIFRPAKGFAINTTVGYLEAWFTKYISYSATGQPLDLSNTPFKFAPKWTISVTPSYSTDFPRLLGFESVKFEGSVNWYSAQNVSAAALSPLGEQPGYGTTDVSINLSGGPRILNFYCRNLADRHYIVYETSPSGLNDAVGDGLPRTYGVTLGYRF
jgi:iron complex outermembrane recepter protein